MFMQLLFIMQEGSTLFLVFIHCITGDVEPARMFDRTGNLTGNQIIKYQGDPSEKWLVLIEIAPWAPEVLTVSLFAVLLMQILLCFSI